MTTETTIYANGQPAESVVVGETRARIKFPGGVVITGTFAEIRGFKSALGDAVDDVEAKRCEAEIAIARQVPYSEREKLMKIDGSPVTEQDRIEHEANQRIGPSVLPDAELVPKFFGYLDGIRSEVQRAK